MKNYIGKVFSLNKILFIYEGAVQEKKFCKLLMDKLKTEFTKSIPKEFIAFKTNIYGLYDEMKNNYGLDIVELIKERASRIGDRSTYNKLATDKDYLNYEISVSECKSYKKLINNISVIKHTNDITSDIFNTIVMHNIEKYIYITKTKIKNYSDYLKKYNRELLLERVVKHMINTNSIYVYNSSLIWGIDYFGEKYWNKYFQETIYLENIPGYTETINNINKKENKEELYNQDRPF